MMELNLHYVSHEAQAESFNLSFKKEALTYTIPTFVFISISNDYQTDEKSEDIENIIDIFNV